MDEGYYSAEYELSTAVVPAARSRAALSTLFRDVWQTTLGAFLYAFSVGVILIVLLSI